MKKKKQIVFLESFSTVFFYKISKLFREKGYETVLLRLLGQKSDKEFYDESFDRIIDFRLDLSGLRKIKHALSAFLSILKLKPYVIIGRATPSAPVALIRRLFRKTPLIYFPYDIRVQSFKNAKTAKEVRGLSDFEINSERYCFENSEGVMHKGAENELDHINGRMLGNNIKLPKNILHFMPYCSDEFIVPLNKNKLSKKDKEIHTAYVASAGAAQKEIFTGIFSQVRDLLESNIHVHVFICSNRDLEKVKDEFLEEYKNFSSIKYLHIHNSLNPKSLIREISKYDYGVWPPFDPIANDYDTECKFATGNKLSTYLEAGLPFLYASKLEFADSLMKKYNLALSVDPHDKNNSKTMDQELKNIDYKELEKNVVLMRNDFNMEKNFHKLEEFIKKVVASKH